MKKKLWALALAAALMSGGAAQGEDMHISGLGTLPFAKDIRVIDGGGTAVESMLRQSMAQPQDRQSPRAAILRFFTMPPGAIVSNGTMDSPAGRARIYQLVKETSHAMYTMTAVAFAGTEEELFPRNKKIRAWWDEAFRQGGKVGRAREMTLISLEDFQRAAREVMARREGDAVEFRVIEAAPWRAYHNDDGTTRWQQQVKFVITTENGLRAAVWMESVLYRDEAGTYHFLIFSGSHESGRQFAEELLYALYQIRREPS